MSWLGIDIGGANIKIANERGYARSLVFSLWKHPEQLAETIAKLLAEAPFSNSIAVTMTGELADCFPTKVKGVEAILDAVEEAASGRTVCVYLCDGRLVSVGAARTKALLAAASNWHVLASFVGRFCSEREQGLLIDIGSTTCDLIALEASGPCAIGKTDPERLAAGELVYTGTRRSPICAVVSELPWRGKPCAVAQELFATTQDAYLLLNELPEEPKNLDTADGRPLTKSYSHARLARSICADTTMFSMADALNAAKAIKEAQLALLLTAARRVIQRMQTTPAIVVLSGQAEFLGRELFEQLNRNNKVISLSAELGSEVSSAACAHALAVLASERADR